MAATVPGPIGILETRRGAATGRSAPPGCSRCRGRARGHRCSAVPARGVRHGRAGGWSATGLFRPTQRRGTGRTTSRRRRQTPAHIDAGAILDPRTTRPRTLSLNRNYALVLARIATSNIAKTPQSQQGTRQWLGLVAVGDCRTTRTLSSSTSPIRAAVPSDPRPESGAISKGCG